MITYKLTFRGDARDQDIIEKQREELMRFAKNWLNDVDEKSLVQSTVWEGIEYEFQAGMPQRTLLEDREYFTSHARDYAPNCKSYKITGDGWEINSAQSIMHALALIPGEIKKAEAKMSGKYYQDVAMNDICRDIEDWEEDHNIIYATDVETSNAVRIVPTQVVAMCAEFSQDQTPSIRIYTTGGHSLLVDARYFDSEWRKANVI